MKIDVDEYDQSRRLYPQWTGRRDKRGIPLYMFEVSHLDNKAIAAYQSNTDSKLQPASSKVPIKMLRLFALYENLTNFVLPLCSTIPNRTHPETPISQSSNIVDISGVSLMQFWKLKNHMQDASVLATAHYPETLDRIFLTGAPGFFNTVWSWIKKWFDPITVVSFYIPGISWWVFGTRARLISILSRRFSFSLRKKHCQRFSSSSTSRTFRKNTAESSSSTSETCPISMLILLSS